MKNIARMILVLTMVVLLAACSLQPVDDGSGTSSAAGESGGGDSPYPGESPLPEGQGTSSSELESALPEESSSRDSSEPETDIQETGGAGRPEEMRAVWISYLDYYDLLKGHSQADAYIHMGEAFEKIRAAGLNTVIVQVRPFADAFYISSYFPWSHVLRGEQGEAPGYDPLAMMVELAHLNDLEIHAWINPYRVQLKNNNTLPPALSENNQAKKWLDSGSDAVVSISSGIYLNPARDEAIQLVVDGVREIVENYDVDGIHFDDYFYPTTDASFDAKAYGEYQEEGGSLPLDEWRMDNVNKLVRRVYGTIKSIDDDVLFGISPQGNVGNNYTSQFADVRTWCRQSGYIDYIMPQMYYGFENSTSPYTETLEEWNEMVQDSGVMVYVGLAVYKIGLEDTWAGEGKYEWQNSTDILKRQVEVARDMNDVYGFCLYRYDSVFYPDASVRSAVEVEMENLFSIMD